MIQVTNIFDTALGTLIIIGKLRFSHRLMLLQAVNIEPQVLTNWPGCCDGWGE